ncbi:MAG: hypothetical protein AMJ93_11860, partial [Anaerolineae bacterium SM23_84]
MVHKAYWGNSFTELIGAPMRAIQAYVSTTRRGERLATLAIPIRLLLVYGVVVRFGINRADFGNPVLLSAVRISVLFFFVYVLLLGYMRLYYAEIFFSDRSKWLQIILDTLVFSVLLFLTQNAKSDLSFMYLIPLAIAADHLDFFPNVLALILVSAAFTSTTYVITSVFVPYPELLFLKVWAPRLSAFGSFTVGYWVLWRLSPARSLDRTRDHLLRAFRELVSEPYLVGEDYRLLWVSPRLQSRHGESLSGQTCFDYFTGRLTSCSGCPLESLFEVALRHKASITINARDVSGEEYQAECTVSPISNTTGARAAVIITDVTARKQLDRELEAYAVRVDDLADAQVSGLVKQIQQINDQLTGFLEAAMLSTVVDQQDEEALDAILAQFAQQVGSSAVILRAYGKNEAGQPGLVLRAAYGLSERRRSAVAFLPLSANSLVVKCFKSGRSQACLDVQDRSQLGIYFGDLARQDGQYSMASFPLTMHGEPVGTCTFYRTKVLPFTPDQMASGQAMASLLAVTLDNLQQYRRQEQRAQERQAWLDILHELSISLGGYEPLESIMRRGLELAKRRLQAETAAVFLWEGGKLRRKAVAGLPDNWFPEESYDSGEGLTGRAIVPAVGQSYGQAIFCNSVGESSDVLQPYVEKYRDTLPSGELKHLIAVPLNDREGSFGVLRVINRLKGGKLSNNGFAQPDVDLFGIMATQVAMAIENARLFEAEKERRELAERLTRASVAVSSSLQLDLVLEQVLDQLGAVVPYDSASVQILRSDGFHIVACRGFDDPERVKRLVFPLDPIFPNTRVFHRKDAHIIDEVRCEYPHFADPRWGGTHIRSWLGVPMRYHGDTIGMIALDSRTPAFYHRDHASIARVFATQAAIALTNAKLFGEVGWQALRSRLMFEVARRLSSLIDIQSLADIVVQSALSVVEAGEGSVLHYLDL